MPEIGGTTAPGFEPVRAAFAANFEQNGEVGAAVGVYLHGEPVVDLWGGLADPATGRPWQRDTLQVVYSTTKGVVAACANLAAQRGELDLDAPVTKYWPEFAAAGKAEVPVRRLLTHEVGLPVLDTPVTPRQAIAWEPVVEALAAQRPVWEPGTRGGYHGLTYGFLVGEVMRRATGRTIGRYLAEEIAAPLDLDLHIGLPEREHHRVSRLVEDPVDWDALSATDLTALPEPMREALAVWVDPTSLARRSVQVITPALDHGTPAAWAAELPSGNATTTARSLARFYAALIGEVDGHRILDESHLAAAVAEQRSGTDVVIGGPFRVGLGFGLPAPGTFWYSPTAFGFPGRGGSIGFADPGSGLAFGYVMNKVVESPPDPRAANLWQAVLACR
ncbi:serine hydrolase domain-containing protein [Pseudonocardia lacus]|uniref:serine hydrolase domain-containing protein n=1 Tax=Pseudonocardia lacus TaxID=2835865 RepID=UPI001BDC7A16|nr:serine hydrolase domain-containing protein [Pseudonocardia lacus]